MKKRSPAEHPGCWTAVGWYNNILFITRLWPNDAAGGAAAEAASASPRSRWSASDLMQGSNGAEEDADTAQAHYKSAALQLLLIVGTFAAVVRASYRMECVSVLQHLQCS